LDVEWEKGGGCKRKAWGRYVAGATNQVWIENWLMSWGVRVKTSNRVAVDDVEKRDVGREEEEEVEEKEGV
jgi:hypothetical protein